ncbi:MAG TPA: hypothetical protein VM124_02730 [Candidatus Limnocylindrales bacterium]|nr:hypothetical protein [Candidatus Limnocylindrales bacterium]
MTTYVLVLHVSLAMLSLGFASVVVFLSKRHQFDAALKWSKKMWVGTITTIVSGILLAVLAKSPITSTCSTLLLFLAVVGAADVYERTLLRKSKPQDL